MRMYNTNNLIQVEGGEKIKQADKGSWLSFVLTDTNRNLVEGINGNTAKVVLYDKDRNKGWTYSTSVSDNKVRFKLPGNLEIGVYDLDITVNNMVFPSDRNTKIEIVEGATSFSGAGVSEKLLELAGYAKTSDLDKKVDKVSGKGLSTNDYTNADKSKVNAIPSSPKYTDTTYKAGSGLSLSGTTFSIDSTIARKSDIPSGVDLSEYAKKSDIPDIDTALGTIDLSSYAKKTDLSNKVDKVSGKGLSTNDYTTTDKNKVNAIPSNPKYTDTTYKAGSGLSLSGTTFSVDSTIARKSDIPSSVDLSGYAKTSDLDKKVDKASGKGLSTNDYTSADKSKVSAIPSSPKYTDTTYKAGSGLSLSGTTFSVDSSVAKKSDIDNIKFSRVYTNDDNDRGTATPGKDYFIRNDGLFGQVSSVDKANNSLTFSTKFDFSQLNNLYLPGDINISEAAYSLGDDEAVIKKYEPYQNHYYLSRDGYLAKIKHYSPIHTPGYNDRVPVSNYIKFSIEETDGNIKY